MRIYMSIIIFFPNYICNFISDVLVATKRCVPRLKDLTADEIVDFFMTVCKCQRLLEQYYKTSSSTVTVQDGVHAGQTVKVSKLINHNNGRTK